MTDGRYVSTAALAWMGWSNVGPNGQVSHSLYMDIARYYLAPDNRIHINPLFTASLLSLF